MRWSPPRVRRRRAAICYALGWTQHSKGVQIIRTAAILQLLLGNIGRPGGGILALRGHASIQGSTDIPTLYDILPGYLPMPRGDGERRDLARLPRASNKTDRPLAQHAGLLYQRSEGLLWEERDGRKRLRLQLSSRRSPGTIRSSNISTDMADGKMEGMFIMGQNPAVAAANSRLQRKALAKLKWLVVRDMVRNRSGTFWCDSPEIERGELEGGGNRDRGFLFPCGRSRGKGRRLHQTQRLLQWREKAVDPPGDCAIRELVYASARVAFDRESEAIRRSLDEPLRALDWWYPEESTASQARKRCWRRSTGGKRSRSRAGRNGPSRRKTALSSASIAKANRITVRRLTDYPELKADGSTACGCWIYSGVLARWDEQSELAELEGLSRPRLGLRLAERSPHHI